MTTLQSQFDAAAQTAMNLPTRPDNETMLRLYALFLSLIHIWSMRCSSASSLA